MKSWIYRRQCIHCRHKSLFWHFWPFFMSIQMHWGSLNSTTSEDCLSWSGVSNIIKLLVSLFLSFVLSDADMPSMQLFWKIDDEKQALSLLPCAFVVLSMLSFKSWSRWINLESMNTTFFTSRRWISSNRVFIVAAWLLRMLKQPHESSLQFWELERLFYLLCFEKLSFVVGAPIIFLS